ncbi:hypothetical protein AHAS_Ahas19G0329100 [Arachis hypogaea]
MEKTKIHVPRVKLGSQGLEVSRLGFGCGGLSGIYNAPLSHEEGCSIIKQVFNKGVTFFDTSDLYGDNHDNEIMVGKALKELPREKVQLATKFGVINNGGMNFEVKGSPEYVRKCCEASLKRLDVQYIDLYYQHRVDTSVPIEDTIGELKRLVNEGKIKYIGLSEANVDTIRRAHAVHPITALQMEYSLWSRDIEETIIPLCRELGIGIVAYSPLGRGFFAGKAVVESLPNQSLLAMHPRFSEENLEKNKPFYKRVDELASKHSCTPSQLALSWLIHQGNDIIPIPGTTKLRNFENNIGSLAVKLTEQDLREISDTVPANEIAGEQDPMTRTPSRSRVNQFGVPALYMPNMRRNASLSVRSMAEEEQKEQSTEPISPVTPPKPQPRSPKMSTKFSDVLAFSGPAPERINGRLAMIGFVAALAVELSNGQDLLSQISNGGIPWFLGTSVVLSLASLIPLFQGVSVESKSGGFMSSDAELWNGRFAMLGLIALAFTEYVKGGTLV